MELFNEIYSCYYHTVRHILAEAAGHSVNMKEMEQIMYRGLSREEVLLLRRLLMQIRDNFFENEKDLEAVKNETFT